MRKIKTQEQIEFKKKRNAVIVAGFFVFILIFSTAGYSFFNRSGSQTEEQAQEGLFRNGDYWFYQKEGKQFVFKNSPEVSSDVKIEIQNTLIDYSSKEVFLVSENTEEIGILASNLRYYAFRIQEACYGDCDKDLPQKDCEDNLIIYEESESNRIYQEKNCVFIEGNSSAIDAFFYRLLNLI